MNKPLALTASAALGVTAFLTGSAPEARANELLDLSPERTRLVQYMPGEVGVGVALLFEGAADSFVHGIIWDLERQRALEVEMEMVEMLPSGGGLFGYDHYGSISGDLFLPADASGPREWVGTLEGEWSIDDGLGHVAGAIFGRNAADQSELAGILQGDFLVGPDGSIRIDPADAADGVPPFIKGGPGGPGGPGWIGGGTGGGSGVGGEQTGGLDFDVSGAGGHSGTGFGGGGIGVDIDDAGGGFKDTGIHKVGLGEPAGLLTIRWKLFD